MSLLILGLGLGGVGTPVVAHSADTTLVSVNAAGTASSGGGSVALSPNGRFVLFVSIASNLVANDTNNTVDAFVRDLQTGRTTLVSVNAAGTASGNSYSYPIALSSNGRYVTFYSYATDLVATSDTPFLTSDAFVRDLRTGRTTLVSVNAAGTATGNSESFPVALSSNGRFVLFESAASDLVTNDTNDTGDVFVRDLQTGRTTLVSVNAAGTASGNGTSYPVALSSNGRFVLFQSDASDLVAHDTNGASDVFVRDLQTGRTTLVSVNAAGTASGNAFSFPVALSANGRYVTFTSYASDLVANDTNNTEDAFVRDLHQEDDTGLGGEE